jgi:pre-mRNA-splicing factor CDC5/CEF1
MLPPAQVGESELEEIVKIGRAGEAAKGLVGGEDDPSGQLLGEYDSLERAKMARTPRTAPQRMFSFSFRTTQTLTEMKQRITS